MNMRLAEREGFEPPVPFGITGFQDQRHQPLGHLSIHKEPALIIISAYGAKVNDNLWTLCDLYTSISACFSVITVPNYHGDSMLLHKGFLIPVQLAFQHLVPRRLIQWMAISIQLALSGIRCSGPL